MGKLHELLAVEGDHEGRAKKLTAETRSTFKNKPTLFFGARKALKMFDQSPERLAEIQALEAKDSAETRVAETVPGALNYLACLLADYYDVCYQKEATNQQARADVVVDGNVLIGDVPVTFLLGLENRLKEFRDVIDEAPTLDSSTNWTEDRNYAPYVFRAPEVTTVKTQKETRVLTLAPATDKHPAQVQPMEQTVNVGQYTETKWSGALSSANKAVLLERVDKLIKAVKQARQRANMQEAVTTKVADAVFQYILRDAFNRDRMNPDATL